MTSCKNAKVCIETLVLAWLAAYGGREMQLPRCNYCNMYQPEGENNGIEVTEDL